MGRQVAKVFSGKLFKGHIECIDSDDDGGGLLYTIVYEDGDKEDLNPKECEEVVSFGDDIKSGRVIEWEVGDE